CASASSTTTLAKRSTDSSPSSRGWSDGPEAVGRARRARVDLDCVPGLGGGLRARAVDRSGRDGLRAARPLAVPPRLARDPRRTYAFLFAARPGARRVPAERVRAGDG